MVIVRSLARARRGSVRQSRQPFKEHGQRQFGGSRAARNEPVAAISYRRLASASAGCFAISTGSVAAFIGP
jgi:hypothetical protein